MSSPFRFTKLFTDYDLMPGGYDRNTPRQWSNLNAFTARITAYPCAEEYEFWGSWTLRMSLEEDSRTGNGPDKPPVWLDGLVPAVAQWYFYAGRGFFTRNDEGEQNAGGGRDVEGGAL